MGFNILFTSIGRRVELLDAWRNAYSTLEIEGNIIGTDIDPLAPALDRVDINYIVPKVTSPNYITSLTKICKKENINLIFPLIDPDIPILANNRDKLESYGAKLIVSPIESINTTRDKWLTSVFFNESNIQSPMSWLPATLDTFKLDYPVFIKPISGSAAKDTFRVETEEELKYYINKIENPIIQEYLPGPEVTTDVICDFSGNILSAVSRQRIEVRWGEVAKGKTIFNKSIMDGCIKIAKGLNAIGPITVQCMFKNDIPYFTEVNMRYGGGAPLGIAAGVNSPEWYLALIAGKKIYIPPIGSYKKELYLSRFDTSLFLTEEKLEKIKSNNI
ncbi:MAG: ATP-grasp domain-containing protein [Bacteroidetes bacterium]|nr:ATP-grasp domain-containing protein [Bacteroidota bacterium]